MKVTLLDSTKDPAWLISMAARRCYASRSKDTPEGRFCFIKGLIKAGHCYDGETEVLTDIGFVKWKDYDYQRVAVVNPDGTFRGFEEPLNIVNYNYNGTVYEYDELGTTVTSGHNLFGRPINNDVKSGGRNSYEYVYHLFRCDATNSSKSNPHSTSKINTEGERTIRIPSCCYKDDSKDPLAQLYGFWVGDGCRAYNGNKLYFHLKKSRKINYLRDLCNVLGFSFVKHKGNKYTVESDFMIGKTVHEHFVCGEEKTIPFSQNPKFIAGIIDGLLNSDGSVSKSNNTCFCSTSKKVIDWLRNYGCLAGYKVAERKGNSGHSGRRNLYLLTLTHFSKRGAPWLINDPRKKNKVKIYDVKDYPVYCVSVSSGIIIVRGKTGNIFLCGNCSVLEHATATFDIEGISRACQNQIVRHRIGCSYCVESMRYVDMSEAEIIVPHKLFMAFPEIVEVMKETKQLYAELVRLGVPKEDARALLPLGTATNMTVTMNFRAIRHFLKLRLSKHAQDEVRQVAYQIYKICQEKWPWLLEGISYEM